MKIRISEPVLSHKAHDLIGDLLSHGSLAGGLHVEALEREFGELVGCQCACVSSGTAGLFLAGQVLGIGAGDTVFVSGFSFVASANAFYPARVVPIDVDPVTFNLDPEDLTRALVDYPKAKALVMVDLYGSTRGTQRALEIARDHGLYVIEDACQAHGAYDEMGRRVGTRAHASVFSFYATKNVAGGEGGCVVSPDPDLIGRVKELRSHGGTDFRVPGLNFRMTEIAAGLCRTQLGELDASNARRRQNAEILNSHLAEFSQVTTPELDPRTHVMHQYTVRFSTPDYRDEFKVTMDSREVETRVFYPYTLARLDWVTSRDLPVASRLSETVLSLPVHPRVDMERLLGALR